MNIREFNRGNIVVRTQRNRRGDGSYIGKKIVFLEIKNGLIYYKFHHSESFSKILPEYGTFVLNDWDEGWEQYEISEVVIRDGELTLKMDFLRAVANNDKDFLVKIRDLADEILEDYD